MKPSLRQLLLDHNADAILLSSMPDIRWASGFTGSNGLLLITPEGGHFITDGRYEAQAHEEVQGATIHVPGYALMPYLAESELLTSGATLVIQSDEVTVAELDEWKALLAGIQWKPVETLLSELVASKSEEEIQSIRAAQVITDAVFDYLVGWIQPGMSEQEVSAEIVYQHLQRGAERMSFDPIVAAGAHGALPHARPTSQALKLGDLVVLDFGCVWEGYASDMTRTIAVGEPGAEARAVYAIVREAQQRAIDAVYAGISTLALDAVAREYIEEAGYHNYFNHGLGHGIGLQTHEWPRISYHVDHELPSGCVFTIEPGIYLPTRFGVRIEDMVVARPEGCENLTQSPKELIVL